VATNYFLTKNFVNFFLKLSNTILPIIILFLSLPLKSGRMFFPSEFRSWLLILHGALEDVELMKGKEQLYMFPKCKKAAS
jgi:hypothetical protein